MKRTPPTPPAPQISSVYRTSDDALHHARCGTELSLLGVRGELEADFFCQACVAHVTLPLSVLGDLPLLVTA